MKDIFVRITLLAIVAVIVMAWLGWLSFSRTSDRATIEINTQEIQQATEKAVQTGRNLAEETSDAIHEATEPQPSNSQKQ